MKNKVLTIEQAESQGFFVDYYDNGDYNYEDGDGIMHLIRNGEEITSGNYVDSYNTGHYKYEDQEGIEHLMKDGEEIMAGKNIHMYDNGDYKYEDQDGIIHLIRNGEEMLTVTGLQQYHSPGSYVYTDHDGSQHYISERICYDCANLTQTQWLKYNPQEHKHNEAILCSICDNYSVITHKHGESTVQVVDLNQIVDEVEEYADIHNDIEMVQQCRLSEVDSELIVDYWMEIVKRKQNTAKLTNLLSFLEDDLRDQFSQEQLNKWNKLTQVERYELILSGTKKEV